MKAESKPEERRVDASHDLASTSELPILSRPDLRRKWLLGSVVATLVLVGAGIAVAVVMQGRAAEQRRALEQRRVAAERQAAEHRLRLAALATAHRGLLVLQSAVDNGVTFVDYAVALNEAAATLEAYEASDDQARGVRDHLAAALEHYQVAYQLMKLMVDVGWPAETSTRWFDRYRRRHPELYAGTATTGRDALLDSWRQARLEMDAAEAELAAYGSIH
jgi:hypothetical protein